MSVIGVRGLVVSNTELSDTAGTPPQAGVDLEPDMNGNELTGIEFDNVTASGTPGVASSSPLLTFPPSRSRPSCETTRWSVVGCMGLA